MTLNELIKTHPSLLAEKAYRLPAFDRSAMIEETRRSPSWLHFGAGNIFRAFQADAAQFLLDRGLAGTGIIAVERRRKKPWQNSPFTVKVTLKSDGSVEKAVIGSIAETLYLSEDEGRIRAVFENPSLQMVTFTISEKGYALHDAEGRFLPDVEADLSAGPDHASSYMGRIASFLYKRFLSCKTPLSMVSMDNCSHNGDRLKESVVCFATAWGDSGFVRWLSESVSFPWAMIDRITPAPDRAVAAMLQADGLDFDTPFVNTEESGYLVMEDDFPNGRPRLEQAGILFADRETVDRAERMKVCTCLNPLHTALAVFGCLLGFRRIHQEIQDPDLKRLAERIGYGEGLPVAADPGIIDPRTFLDTVLEVRFKNPFLPDTPQRIATDTSQKLPIRFGRTVRSYLDSDTLDVSDLSMIPLVFAGWLRYLMAMDDNGEPFEPSPDPLLPYARDFVRGFHLGEKPDFERLKDLLQNTSVFGVDLIDAGLAEKVCLYLTELTGGPGAVRAALHRHVWEEDLPEGKS